MSDELRKARVVLSTEVDADLPLIAFDRVQIQQVLINLMRNASEAMEAVSGPRKMNVRAQRAGDAVAVRVSDRGMGFDEPDRIFEPFFTTKAHGMGMGLAISRSIVESHGGRLSVEKNEDDGTTFVFTLPIEAKEGE
jgi:C4-dicarboxylate-specific signal transduction histidine kinase